MRMVTCKEEELEVEEFEGKEELNRADVDGQMSAPEHNNVY